MRLEMEQLLHKYGADIVLQGHVHSCAQTPQRSTLCASMSERLPP